MICPRPPDPREVMSIASRLVALRRAGKLGAVYCDEGRFAVCWDPYDLEGTRVRLSLDQARELCVRLETGERKPVGREGSYYPIGESNVA